MPLRYERYYSKLTEDQPPPAGDTATVTDTYASEYENVTNEILTDRTSVPFNRTSRINDLNAMKAKYQSQINQLNAQIAEVDAEIALLEAM
jgi:DNA repair ATPase RecN